MKKNNFIKIIFSLGVGLVMLSYFKMRTVSTGDIRTIVQAVHVCLGVDCNSGLGCVSPSICYSADGLTCSCVAPTPTSGPTPVPCNSNAGWCFANPVSDYKCDGCPISDGSARTKTIRYYNSATCKYFIDWCAQQQGVVSASQCGYCTAGVPTPTGACQPYSCFTAPDAGHCPDFTSASCNNPLRGDGVATCDNCGGLQCTSCAGSNPTAAPGPTATPRPTSAPGCVPNCAADPCRANLCSTETCIGACGTESCYGAIDCIAPTFNSLVIKNASAMAVPADSSNRNNICESDFYDNVSPRTVVFEANVYDDNGGNNITEVRLSWNDSQVGSTMTYVSTSGNNALYRLTVSYTAGQNSSGTYPIKVKVTDANAKTSGWVNTGREWKVWNCDVSVSGVLYDGSLGQACNKIGFTVGADSEMGFSGLIYKNISSSGDINMATNLPANYGPTNIVFGADYLPIFNGGSVSDPDGSLMVTSRLTRIIDLGTGTTSCSAEAQFNISSSVSAYSNNPQAVIDFSFLGTSLGWFQVVGAGVKAKNEVGSGVPASADASSRALTISRILADNGLVSFSTYRNINGNNSNSDYGLSNNWWIGRNTNDSTVYSYQYFYNNFYINRDIGVTGSGWGAGKPTEGVYFVNGNLTINNDFALAANKTLMVVVKGSITIEDTVNRIDGIYVADGGITASGTSTTQLVINGMLYSRGNISLNRSYTDAMFNNRTPAVKVNYQPNLIFNMPGTLMRVLSGWREE